jgi:hypothetical protein
VINLVFYGRLLGPPKQKSANLFGVSVTTSQLETASAVPEPQHTREDVVPKDQISSTALGTEPPPALILEPIREAPLPCTHAAFHIKPDDYYPTEDRQIPKEMKP